MEVRYWAVRLGEGGKYVAHAKKGNYIAIGWNELGNLNWLTDKRIPHKRLEKRLEKGLKDKVGLDSPISIGLSKGMVWNFVREMKKNDLVLVPDPVNRKILVGRIVGPYTYKKEWGDGCYYAHRRKVDWIKEVDKDQVPEKLKEALNSWLTVFSLDNYRRQIDELLGLTVRLKAEEVTGDDLVEAIIDKLMDLNPREFEDFVKHLLSIVGFEAATTSYVGDKGVDVIGSLNMEGFANIKLRVQVKKTRSPIGIDEVLKIRGTLASDEHGAIVTLSNFTRQALQEAQSEKKKPIALIDGETLADLILKYYDELDENYKKLFNLKRREIPLRERFSIVIRR